MCSFSARQRRVEGTGGLENRHVEGVRGVLTEGVKLHVKAEGRTLEACAVRLSCPDFFFPLSDSFFLASQRQFSPEGPVLSNVHSCVEVRPSQHTPPFLASFPLLSSPPPRYLFHLCFSSSILMCHFPRPAAIIEPRLYSPVLLRRREWTERRGTCRRARGGVREVEVSGAQTRKDIAHFQPQIASLSSLTLA